MATSRPAARAHTVHGDGSLFSGLLRGRRFSVCADRFAAARALDVRRRVYNGTCGYPVPVPDEYDRRSWLLLAEDAASGEAVGSMRITPRWAGPVEAEEYFTLPAELRSPRLLEVTRFAVVPDGAETGRSLPAVALGLLKLSARFMALLGAGQVVICSRLDRVHFYRWLGFQPTGLTAAYRKLSNLEHALLTCDFRDVDTRGDPRHWKLFLESPHGEIVIPPRIPPLGLGAPQPARPARRPPVPTTRNGRITGAEPTERPFLVRTRKTP